MSEELTELEQRLKEIHEERESLIKELREEITSLGIVPLTAENRNQPCKCRSGKKTKKCCGAAWKSNQANKIADEYQKKFSDLRREENNIKRLLRENVREREKSRALNGLLPLISLAAMIGPCAPRNKKLRNS